MGTEQELIHIPNIPPATQTSIVGVNIESLLSKAVDAKSAVEVLERLAEMRREMKAEAAKEAYDHALAEFQAECPIINKGSEVKDKSGKPRYRYATLDAIVLGTKELLRKHGFSYTLTADVDDKWVTAILKAKHSSGHAEESRFKVPIDPNSYMNEAQKFASALTFAKRYAFCNGFGILTGDVDDDGAGTDPEHAAGQDRKPRQNAPGGAGSSAGLPRQGPGAKTSAPSQQQTQAGTKKPAQTPQTPFPSEATHKWFLDELQKTFPEHLQEVAEFFEKAGILLPNENLTDIPLRWVPNSRAQFRQISEAIGAFAAGDEAKMPYASHPEPGEPKKKAEPKKETAAPGTQEAEADSGPDSPDAPWRSFPMPWGKQAGVMLADLDKKYLFGLWANYEVETEYNGKPCKPEKIAKDREFRAMLDQAGLHYNFQKT